MGMLLEIFRFKKDFHEFNMIIILPGIPSTTNGCPRKEKKKPHHLVTEYF